ncbi:MAG: ACT domain-containing protein [Oscillospiraceae bacterium]|jgi:hypothetical protein|nr:ACT domain-containing protein [Oscillospiraceae bacterium]
MAIDQISIFVENSPGRLAEVTQTLGAAGIDLRAMSIADTMDFGILRLIVSEPARALDVLKAAQCVVSVTPVLAVSVADKPGSLAQALSVLAAEGISVEYAYAFIARQQGNAYVIFRVEDNERAQTILLKNGIQVVQNDELYSL